MRFWCQERAGGDPPDGAASHASESASEDSDSVSGLCAHCTEESDEDQPLCDSLGPSA